MCLKFQTRSQLLFERVFSSWADIVSKRTLCIFLISMIIFGGLSSGIIFAKQFEDQTLIWTPSDNPTLQNRLKSEELFPAEKKLREITLMVEATDRTDSLITTAAFEEMRQFEQLLYSVEEYSDTGLDALNRLVRKGKGKIFGFADICMQAELQTKQGQIVRKCMNSAMPLDFIFEKSSNSYRLDVYDSDEKLVEKVRTGKGDLELFKSNKFLFLEGFLAATEPEQIEQQLYPNPANPSRTVGTNDLQKARVSRYSYYIDPARNLDVEENAYLGFEETLHAIVKEWSAKTTTARFTLYTKYGYVQSWSSDLNSELISVAMAIGAVFVYCVMFLGSFSPIHCRCMVAFGGAISVLLAFTAGFGLLCFAGFSYSTFHSWLPFLLMCIGVEHFFVICHAVDEQDLLHSSYTRVHAALSKAGPDITVTSFATSFAFAFGMFSSLEALRSFCLFATVCNLMLWLASMTIFLAFVVSDSKRVQDKRRECAGAFCCPNDSLLCCRGKLMSRKQREHCDLDPLQVVDEGANGSQQNDSGKEDPEEVRRRSFQTATAQQEIERNSLTQIFCGMILGPKLLHDVSRVIWMVLYALLIAGAFYQAIQVRVYFTKMYFVSESSDIKHFFDADEQYFKAGGEMTTTYVQNGELEYSEIVNQNKLHRLNIAVQDCVGCQQGWHLKQTLVSWSADYNNWVSTGDCPFVTPATIPGQRIVLPEQQFYQCFELWLKTDEGLNQKRNIVIGDDGKIKGWRQFIWPVKIEDIYNDGPQYLRDTTDIANHYGIKQTYSYSDDMLVHEMFVSLVSETILSSLCSVGSVFLVVFLITGSAPIGFVVMLSVGLVYLGLSALISLWDLTFNNVVVVHLIASLGLSVLYSAHIAHTYLLVEPPLELPVSSQRVWKSQVALSRMGSSMLHGIVAAAIAVIIAGVAQESYFFVVFFKMWTGIIAFGCANAFIFIPILLSIMGPTPDFQDKTRMRKSEFFSRMNTLSRAQAEAMHFQYHFRLEGEQQNNLGLGKGEQLAVIQEMSDFSGAESDGISSQQQAQTRSRPVTVSQLGAIAPDRLSSRLEKDQTPTSWIYPPQSGRREQPIQRSQTQLIMQNNDDLQQYQHEHITDRYLSGRGSVRESQHSQPNSNQKRVSFQIPTSLSYLPQVTNNTHLDSSCVNIIEEPLSSSIFVEPLQRTSTQQSGSFTDRKGGL